MAQGIVTPDLVSTLGARLARLSREITPEQAQEIAAQADGKPLETLTSALMESLDADANAA